MKTALRCSRPSLCLPPRKFVGLLQTVLTVVQFGQELLSDLPGTTLNELLKYELLKYSKRPIKSFNLMRH